MNAKLAVHADVDDDPNIDHPGECSFDSSGGRALLADIIPASCVDGPGNRFVVFFQGCGFDCRGCHNPHTIPQRRVGTSWWASLDEVIEHLYAAAPFVCGVTASGGEATRQWPFVRRLFETIKVEPSLARLTTLVDSNGDTAPAVWDELAPVMDGAMIDLKAFEPELHEWLTGHSNDRVLASITQLHELGKLHEVRLLLIPDINDREDDLAAIAEWLIEHAPGTPVRLNGFRHHGTRRLAADFDDATPATLADAVDALTRYGLDPTLIATWPPTPAP